MSTAVAQVRLPKGVLDKIDTLVTEGDYTNRSDVIRVAVRKFLMHNELNKLIGTMKNTGDSEEEVRKIRKILSKQAIDLDEINSLGEK